MIRLVLLFLVVYVFWRILRSAAVVVIKRPHSGSTSGQRQHRPDLSDVQEADYEDVTPRKKTGNDSPRT